MNKGITDTALSALVLSVLLTPAAYASNVKITPLGSHDGEFCRYDRAMVFEDSNGTRILYDAGRTVRGPDDPRLGNIDAVLLSHVHGDHLGDKHQAEANAGTCAEPDFSVNDTPTSNTVNIAVAKKATFVVGGEMNSFFSKKVEAAGGDPKQVKLVRFGSQLDVNGVAIASVPAVHSNGLTVYLSGDTGITAEQDLVVRQYYKTNLTVINIGGTFTTGPTEAAYVMNKLVKPKSIIASHANEQATQDGKPLAGTKTEAFMNAAKARVYLPLSGKTMEFDGKGKCEAGC